MGGNFNGAVGVGQIHFERLSRAARAAFRLPPFRFAGRDPRSTQVSLDSQVLEIKRRRVPLMFSLLFSSSARIYMVAEAV